jgi:hypothetical protein
MNETTPVRSLTLVEQIALCQQMARLNQATLPLLDQLAVIGQGGDHRLGEASKIVRHRLLEGKSLTDALVTESCTDSRILAACLDAGLSSQRLDEALQHWTSFQLANQRASLNLRSAMIYPACLVLAAILSVSFGAWTLIPEIISTYEMFDANVPSWMSWGLSIRQRFHWFLIVMSLCCVSPVAIWLWNRRRLDPYGVPQSRSTRLRLQALATQIAKIQLDAQRPLPEILPRCAAAMGMDSNTCQKAFKNLRLHQPLGSLPLETTMILASVYCGIIRADQAAKHCQQISLHQLEMAELREQRETRWLPMLVAIAVGTVTLITYGLLIYAPWAQLMTRIGKTD